jgi:hypothetical protein
MRRMPHRRNALLAAAAILLARAFLDSAAAAQPQPIKVLFVGNSLVYYHNMPAMLTALARSTGGPPIEVGMVVDGGASLRDHWNNGKALAAIRAAKWNFVVLVDQSTFGRAFLVNGKYRVGSADELFESAPLFAKEIKAGGAAVVLLDHWKDRGAPERDQSAIDHAYMKVGREIGALVVPAGAAFTAFQLAHPSLSLFDPDDHHPSALGSYLLASVVYSAILHHPPLGGASVIEGQAVDEDTGNLLDRVVTLVTLPGKLGEEVHRVAGDVAKELADHGGFDLIPLPAMSLPATPRGRATDFGLLLGKWKGPVEVYPTKGILELTIGGQAGSVQVQAAITFGGRPDDIRVAPAQASFDGKRLSFVDLKGPNGSQITYCGALDGLQLAGTAEIRSADDSIYGIGEWRLTKQ